MVRRFYRPLVFGFAILLFAGGEAQAQNWGARSSGSDPLANISSQINRQIESIEISLKIVGISIVLTAIFTLIMCRQLSKLSYICAALERMNIRGDETGKMIEKMERNIDKLLLRKE